MQNSWEKNLSSDKSYRYPILNFGIWIFKNEQPIHIPLCAEEHLLVIDW